jgi:hypothetical protein
MPVRRRARSLPPRQAFLNVPYSRSYEKLLVALTAALVAVGRVPRLTFQIPEGGDGRLRRIYALLQSCDVSIHDLSRVGLPVRFNMPFELGLAYAIKITGGRHDLLVLEKKAHRLDRHLSDLRGIDPMIHGGTAQGAICAVLEVLEKPEGNPTAAEVMRLYRLLRSHVPELKQRHRNKSLFSTRVYGELVAFGWDAARLMGL